MKRGISELIATVLIIGFTVALGAIVIIWGGRFVSETQSEVDVSAQSGISCTKVNFDIKSVDCSPPSGSITSINLINKADKDIADFIIRITDTSDQTLVISTGVNPLTSFSSSTISLSGTPTNPKKVELIPQITGSNNELFACNGAKAEFNINDGYDNGDCRTSECTGQPDSTPCTNDGNICTSDYCLSEVCVHPSVSDGTSCSDGAFCNGDETCSGGSCQAGTPPAINDGIACTADSCDETNDVVLHAPNNGLCSDGAFCNGDETCSATLGCQSGASPCVAGEICSEQDNDCGISLTSCTPPGGSWQADRTYYVVNPISNLAGNCLDITSPDVTVDCLNIPTNSITSSGSAVVLEASNIKVKNCTISGANRGVLIFTGASGASVLGNSITGGQWGVSIPVSISNINILDNLINVLSGGTNGIYFSGLTGNISGNTFIVPAFAIGIRVTSSATGIAITNNNLCGGASIGRNIQIESSAQQIGTPNNNGNSCAQCIHSNLAVGINSNICIGASGGTPIGSCGITCTP